MIIELFLTYVFVCEVIESKKTVPPLRGFKYILWGTGLLMTSQTKTKVSNNSETTKDFDNRCFL